MSAPSEVACRGAPRDLGLDQGAALRDAIRAEAACVRGGALAPLRRASAERALGRAVRRHQPHLYERLEGMALGAGVPVWALLRLLGRDLGAARGSGETEPAAPLAPEGSLALAATGEREGEALLVLVPAGVSAERLVLRRSAPEVGFACLEMTLPWLPHALAGVNERGLAAAWLPGAPAPAADRAGEPPPALLVQECLERLGGVEEAVERCERRAGRGRATLLFADASGALAGLAFGGARRRVLRPEAGVLVAPAGDPRAPALAKRARAEGFREGARLAARLVRGASPHGARAPLRREGEGAPAAARLVADPSRRRTGIAAETRADEEPALSWTAPISGGR